MSTKNIFRSIIIVNFLTLILTLVLPFLPLYNKDKELNTLLEWNGYGSYFDLGSPNIFILSIFGIVTL